MLQRPFDLMAIGGQELRRTEQLALLGRLAAGVSHALRNPLNTVFLRVDLLDEELRQPTPDGQTLMRESVATLKHADEEEALKASWSTQPGASGVSVSAELTPMV